GPSGERLVNGAEVTLQLAGTALVLAMLLGFVLGVARWASITVLKPVCWFFIEFTRNTPPLVQILFWSFSATAILPSAAIVVLRDHGFEFIAAAFALGIYHSGFVAEIVRGGLNAIPRGQFEAAQAIGFGFLQTTRYILLPQLLRLTMPTLTSE